MKKIMKADEQTEEPSEEEGPGDGDDTALTPDDFDE